MAITHIEKERLQKVVIVHNRNSGKQLFASVLSRVNEIHKLLKGFLPGKQVELWDVHRFEELEGVARRLVAERADWLIIAGGDGTIRALTDYLLQLDYRPYVSVFPAGTVNLVAKELQLSIEPERWFRRVSRLAEAPVYLGRANGRAFLTVLGIGFDSLVVDSVGELEKKLLSKFAYVVQGTELMRKELIFSHWSYRFQVRFDQEEEWHEGSSVIVGKSRYYAGRYKIFNDASLAKPLLYVALFQGGKRLDFLRYTALIGMEALTMDKSILFRRAKQLEIRCNAENFVAELDGDAVAHAPLAVAIEERPLSFIA